MKPADIKAVLKLIPPPETCEDLPCEFSPPENPHPPVTLKNGLKCDGYGYLLAQDGSVSRQRCPCWVAAHTADHSTRYLGKLPIETRDIIVKANEGLHAAGELFRTWKPSTSKAVFIQGATGTGKTVAGHRAVLKMISLHNSPAIYLRTRQIASDCLAMATSNGERYAAEDRLAAIKSACEARSIIFLDDLGAERESAAAASRIAGYIDTLHDRRAPCVIVTSLVGLKIEARYGRDTCSRLSDASWMTRVTVTGTDLRINQRNLFAATA